VSYFDTLTDSDWSNLYKKYDPLDFRNDERRRIWEESEEKDFLESSPFLSGLGGAYSSIAGDSDEFSNFIWEPEFYQDFPTADGLGATLQKTAADIGSLYSGAGLALTERLKDLPDWMVLDESPVTGETVDEVADRKREEFQDALVERDTYAQVLGDVVESQYETMPDPEAAATGGMIGTALAQELPFLAASAGVGNVAAAIGRQGVRYGAQRLGREVGEEAVERLAGRAGRRLQKKMSIGSMAGIHGLRSGAGTYAAALDTYAAQKVGQLRENNPDLTGDQIWDIAYANSAEEALLPATIGGAATAGIVGLFGATGIEALLANPKAAQSIGGIIKASLKQSQFEGAEEVADSIAQSIVQTATYNPDKPWEQIVNEIVTAYGLGAAMGGTYTGVGSIPGYVGRKAAIRKSNKELRNERSKQREEFKKSVAPQIKSFREAQGEEITEEEVEQIAEQMAVEIIDNNQTVLAEAEAVETEEDLPVVYDEELETEEDLAYQEYEKARQERQSQTARPEERDLIFERLGFQRKRDVYIAEELEKLKGQIVPSSQLEDGMTVAEFHQAIAELRADERIEKENRQAVVTQEDGDVGIGTTAPPAPPQGPRPIKNKTIYELGKNLKESRDGILIDIIKRSDKPSRLPLYKPSSIIDELNKRYKGTLPENFDKLSKEEKTEIIEDFLAGWRERDDFTASHHIDNAEENHTEETINSVDGLGSIVFFRKGEWKLYNEGETVDVKSEKVDMYDGSVRYSRTITKQIGNKRRTFTIMPGGGIRDITEVDITPAVTQEDGDVGTGTTTPEQSVTEAQEAPTPTLPPQPETDYVIANTVKRKVGKKFNWVKDDQVKDAPIEVELEYTLRPENPQQAVLKYNKNTKSWGIGYYQGVSSTGKPKFNEEFTIQDDSAIETILDSKKRVVGARIPKNITTQDFIANDQNKEDGRVWKVTKSDTGKRTDKAKTDVVPQQEIALKVVDAIKNQNIKNILKPLVESNTVTLGQMRALINAAGVKGAKGTDVYAGTVADPSTLGRHLLKAISNSSEPSVYRRIVGDPRQTTTPTDESTAGSLKDEQNLALSLKSKAKGKGLKERRTVALISLLQAAGEKAEANKAGLFEFDEARQAGGTGRLQPTTQQTQAEALDEFAPEDFEVDQAAAQQQRESEAIEAQVEESIDAAQGAQRQRTLEDREADAFVKEQADKIEGLANSSDEQQSKQGRQILRRLDSLNLNPETMTEQDKVKARKFAEQVHKDPQTFYENLPLIKQELAGSIASQKKRGATSTIPDLPKAKGAAQIKELVNRTDNGLTEEQRRVFNKFIEVLDQKTLALLTLEITGGVDIDGNETVTFDGTFNALTNAAKIANSANPEVVAEEIAHFTAKLLPEQYRKRVKSLQLKAFEKEEKRIKKAIKKATGTERLILQTELDILDEAKKSAGELSSANYARIRTNAAAKNGIILSEVPSDTPLYYDSIAGSIGEGLNLWSYPAQDISSADTSINQGRMPTTFTSNFVEFVPGGINADIGGGRFDNATEYLKSLGVENLIYDPFNRTIEHNNQVVARIANGQADTATVNNVLNVIKEARVRQLVIAQAANAVKPGGTVYFKIFEGNRTGEGASPKTKPDNWQENRKAADYLPEIENRFGNVQRRGDIIIAKEPKIESEIAGSIAAFNPGNWEQGEGFDAKALQLIDKPQVNTPEFVEWFGDSVVKTADGKPLIFFHATTFDGQIDRFDELSGFIDRKRAELGLSESDPLPDYVQAEVVQNNNKRIGHFFSPDPVFGQLYLGNAEPGTEPYNKMSSLLLSDNKLVDNDAAYFKSQSTDLTIYPVYIRAENPFDGSNPEHRLRVEQAVADAYADAAYLQEQLDMDKAWSSNVKLADALNYQQEPDVAELESFGYTQEEIDMELETFAEESAKINAALERLSNGFSVETVGNLQQIQRGIVREDLYLTRVKESINQLEYKHWSEVEKFTRHIKYAGFDGYYINEMGRDNLAVFDNNQIKSAISNTGEFSTDPDSVISGSISQEQAGILDRIDQDLYGIINPDEFYARNLVKQSTEGAFKRGVEIALDIVSALLDNSLIRVESVAARREKRRFFSEVEKMLKTGKGLDFNRAAKPGGLLTRSAMDAGSIYISSAKKLTTDLSTLEKAGRGESADLLKGQAAAATTTVSSVLNRILAGKTPTKQVSKLIKKNIVDSVGAVAADSILPKEYEAQKQKFIEDGRPELAKVLADTSLTFLKTLQSRMRWVETNYQSLAKELRSERVKKIISKADDALQKEAKEVAIFRELERQFRIAAIAVASESTDVRAANVLLNIAGNEETLLENQRDVANIRGKAKEIARVVSKAALGSEILEVNPNATAADVAAQADRILEVYSKERTLNPNAPALAEPGTKTYKKWQLAAGVLATNKSLKENALSLVFSEDGDLEQDGIQKFADDLIRGLEDKNPLARAKAIAAATKRVTNYAKKSERQRLIFQKQYEPLNTLFNRLQAYNEARQIADRFLNDPELKAYLATLNKDAKAIETPVFRIKEGKEGVEEEVFLDGVMPDNYQNNTLIIPVPQRGTNKAKVVVVEILSDKKGDENLARMREAYDAITDWLITNGAEHEYFDYYQAWQNSLENIYMSELVMHPKQNVRALGSKWSLSVLDQTLNNIPGRSVEVTKQLVRKHNLYYQRMAAWAATYGDAWKNKMKAAAKSHGYDTNFNTIDRDETYRQWELSVGNELRASHQEGGRNLEEGDFLMSGEQVTEADMALLNFEGQITDEAYALNQNIADLDKSVTPTYIVDRKKGAAPIVRLPLAKGKTFLPRVFSERAKTFLSNYRTLRNATPNGELGPKDFSDLFTGHEEALLSFIVDRNPEFIKRPSELEEAYSKLAAAIGDGSLDSVSADDVVDFLQSETGKGRAEIKQLILSEYKDILNSLERIILPSENTKRTAVYTDLEAEGPFVKARSNALGPYYFYQYGFRNESDLKKFALMGSSKPLENVMLSIQSIQREYETLENNIIKRRRELIKEGFPKNSPALEKRLRKEFKLEASTGATYIPTIDELYFWKRRLGDIAETYATAYSPGSAGSKEDIMPGGFHRAQSAVIGSTLLAAGTLVKNSTDASVIGGSNLAAAQGQTGAASFLKGLLLRWPTSIGKLGVSTGASAIRYTTGLETQLTRTEAGKKVFAPRFSWDKPALIFKSLPAMMDAFIKAKGLHKATAPITGFLAPAAEEFFQNMPLRLHEARLLKERGLDMPVTPIETEQAFYGDLMSGGNGINSYKTDSEFIQLLGRSIQSGFGQAEAALALVGRPVFPRMGDISGNVQLWNAGIEFVRNIERMLRLSYNRRKTYGDNLTEDISEEELLGRYLYVMRANKASFNNALGMMARGGVTNFQKEAKKFFQDLESGEETQFLTDLQRNSIAEGWVTQSNSATPSNRPTWARLTKTNQMLLALMGWGTNAIQNLANVTLGRGRKGTASDKAQQSFAGMIWMLGLMASSIPAGILAMILINWFNRTFMAREPKKGMPYDKKDPADAARSFLGLSLSSVPMVGAWLESLVDEAPSRGMMHPGSLFASKAGVVVKYLAETAETKDPTYGLNSLARGMAPMVVGIGDQFTEYGQGWLGFTNASNAIRNFYKPSDVKHFKGQTIASSVANINVLTNDARLFQSALGRGDVEEATRLRIVMLNSLKEENPKLSKEEVLDRLNSHLRLKTPLHYALAPGTIPTRSQFIEEMSVMEAKDNDWFKKTMKTLDTFNQFYIDFGIDRDGIWKKEEDTLPYFRMQNPQRPGSREPIKKSPTRLGMPQPNI
jgi:hypothetical protein